MPLRLFFSAFSHAETTTAAVVPSADLTALLGDKVRVRVYPDHSQVDESVQTTSLSKYVTEEVSKAALLVLYVEDEVLRLFLPSNRVECNCSCPLLALKF